MCVRLCAWKLGNKMCVIYGHVYVCKLKKKANPQTLTVIKLNCVMCVCIYTDIWRGEGKAPKN